MYYTYQTIFLVHPESSMLELFPAIFLQLYIPTRYKSTWWHHR